MTEFSHHGDYDAMQREMQALRKRIEDLEAHRGRPFRRWRWRWLPITAAVLLAIGVLGAQSKQDALSIAPNGNVGINETNPTATLDVNGTALVLGDTTIKGDLRAGKNLEVTSNAVVRGQLQGMKTIPAVGQAALPANSGVVIGNSDIYFTDTPHSHTGQGNQKGFAAIENDSSPNYNGLMIMGRNRAATCCDRTVLLWDKLGIARSDPKSALDVIGEIRGKPWMSNEFEWQQGQAAVPMTTTSHSVCFLTLVSGKYMGKGEGVYIGVVNGRWVLTGFSQQQDVRARARCIGAPDDSWK